MSEFLCSLITIVNKEKVYQDFLNNLHTQKDISYELITIDNKQNEFTSARMAYNQAAKKAKGKYLVFLHPDIRFLNPYSLKEILTYIQTINTFGVVGIAGSPKELVHHNRIILTNIKHGDNKQKVAESHEIAEPTEVQTVDEALFIIKKTYWEQQPFPSKEGWHLYAVEQCLIANIDGLKNYVVPADIWHTSDGKSEDYRYTIQIKKLIKQYQTYTNTINTTVKRWQTSGIKAKIFLNYYLIKMYVKHILKM